MHLHARPVHNSVGGKCRLNECRRHERRRHHPLSTGARRATSASRGAERSAAPTCRPKSAAIGRRAYQIEPASRAQRPNTPKFCARGGFFCRFRRFRHFVRKAHYFPLGTCKFWRTLFCPILLCLLCEFYFACSAGWVVHHRRAHHTCMHDCCSAKQLLLCKSGVSCAWSSCLLCEQQLAPCPY